MVRIISDSTCDLSKELIEKYNIEIIPLHIHLGEEEFEDGKNITPDDIYKWSDAHNTTPKTAAEIAGQMEVLKKNVRSSFVVDTLTYLHRGGRCGSVAALAGGVLKLHPKIVVEDGSMGAKKKYRGKMNSVIKTYVNEMEEELLTAKKDRVFITHSGCEESLIDEVKQYLQSLNHFDEILVTRAGGVISSHCGPGTLGVLYIAS